jgi:DNA-binding MarR family transcriptional regulator
VNDLAELPEILFEVGNLLAFDAATEVNLIELPPAELETLRIISISPGRGVGYLCERTKIRQANMSVIVRSLMERGLVSKEPDERDRRAVRLYATPQARRDLTALRKVWLSRLVRSLDAAGVNEVDRQKLLVILEGVRTNM